MIEGAALPRWDLSGFFPPVADDSFADAMEHLGEAVAGLAALFDERRIGDHSTAEPAPSNAAPFDEVMQSYLELRTRLYLMEAYLECLTAADSRDDIAQARLSELQPILANASVLQTRLTAWVGSLDVDALSQASGLAREHGFFLMQSQLRARHLMSPDQESLAADLVLTGSTAWERMRATLTSQLLVPIEIEEEVRQLPMSAIRNLAESPDRSLRRRAYESELATWHQVRVPLAAAMNGIKGEVHSLARRRGWSSPLEATLLEHAIDRRILEAMMDAVEASFDDFRVYLRAKARRMGLETLTWYDLYAPIADTTAEWSYPRAADFIREHFRRFSPLLEGTAQRAFDEGWIDAEPRPGKVGGAFCMWMGGEDSRILTNFLPTHQAMSTLAHELGHAYHNRARAARTIVQRRTPATLTETASIFCQTLIDEAAYQDADDRERLAILEAFLQSACAIVVDIAGRFYFEQKVFERRRQRDLSPDELCDEMRHAQGRSYGDGLDPATYHPYMWAVKPHYYSGTASFYNYPYTFGLLFGLGLYSIFRDRPDRFVSEYEDLLSRTGMANAADLARGFGLDLHAPAFWRASLDMVRERIKRFETLARRAD